MILTIRSFSIPENAAKSTVNWYTRDTKIKMSQRTAIPWDKCVPVLNFVSFQ